MEINLSQLKTKLCDALCTDVKLFPKNGNLIFVETPFTFDDGDIYSIYIKTLNGGIFRISDCGHTLMHLSYENDISKFRNGTRGKIFEQIFSQMNVQEKTGELYIDSTVENLATNLLRFSQAITQICDLTFLNQTRAESTFYEDLWESLTHIVNQEIIKREYYIPHIKDAKDYPVDFFIKTISTPLYVFGIPNHDKAMLTTIILEHLLRKQVKFESLLVFADQSSISRPDLARLSNVGGEMISSLDAQEDLKRKIEKRVNFA